MFACALCAFGLNAQEPHFTRVSILEIQFSLLNCKINQPFVSPKSMQGGLGIAYIKAINNHFDWRFTLNGTYADSLVQKKLTKNEKSLLIQADAAICGTMRSFKMGKSAMYFPPFQLAGQQFLPKICKFTNL